VDELVHQGGPRVLGAREVVVAEDDAVGGAEAAADGLGAMLDADEGAGDGAAGLRGGKEGGRWRARVSGVSMLRSRSTKIFD